jgi:ABC-type multidrug transport system fused ATPase/permease subunit
MFRTADLIVAIKDGQVQEEGTHEELMKLEGLYHSLVMRLVKGMRIRREYMRSS